MNAGRTICNCLTSRVWCLALVASWLCVGVAVAGPGPAKASDTFDPLGFPGDTAVVTDDVPVAGRRLSGARATARHATADSATAAIVLEVQFLATTNLTEAKDIRQRAEAALKDSVRLDFETPYYKLRTGRFLDYDEAEALAVRLRAMGYESAWVVRHKNPPPATPRVR